MSWIILFKKQLFDLSGTTKKLCPRQENTIQNTIIWPWGQRSRSHKGHYGHAHTKYNWPISKDKNVMAWTRKYYLKNNYLTLRSKVKVTQRSLWYATHHLVVMHPHTKYHWSIWKDKKVMVRTSFAEKRQKKKKRKQKIRLKQYVSLRSKGRHNNINKIIVKTH